MCVNTDEQEQKDWEKQRDVNLSREVKDGENKAIEWFRVALRREGF